MTTNLDFVFRLMPDGGFVAGNKANGVTGYAYPGSFNAAAAKKHINAGERGRGMLHNIIADMVRDRTPEEVMYPHLVEEYDARNWERLRGPE